MRLGETSKHEPKQFPGLLYLEPDERAVRRADEHSLFFGEAMRWKRFFRSLDAEAGKYRRVGYSLRRAHQFELQSLHDYFVGKLSDKTRAWLPMYDGTPNDFASNFERWKEACTDVEEMYGHLRRYLPAEACVRGRWVGVHAAMERASELTNDDPIELIRLARRHAKTTESKLVRHHAAAKLVLSQFAFESRLFGYAPEQLAAEARGIERQLGWRLFDRPDPEPVTLLATLDPDRAYACRDWRIYGEGEKTPKPGAHQVTLAANRRTILAHPSGKPIQLLFFIRPKRHSMLKAVIKDTRFPHFPGIGDGIAMMFVVEREDLDEAVRRIREVLANCPGQVFDQMSSIGYRMGRKLDESNLRSSTRYEAKKYNELIAGKVVEVQFAPTSTWIDAHCMHNEVNHGWYKLIGFLDRVFPTLFPEPLTGVPWRDEEFRRQGVLHVLKNNVNGVLV